MCYRRPGLFSQSCFGRSPARAQASSSGVRSLAIVGSVLTSFLHAGAVERLLLLSAFPYQVACFGRSRLTICSISRPAVLS